MNICRKIQYLLRLAELCDPSESERKRKYMDSIDVLMDEDESFGEEKKLTSLFDFNTPENLWHWDNVSNLLVDNEDLFVDYNAYTLGRDLAALVTENLGIKRKRTKAGVYYFLPPLKGGSIWKT